MNPLFTRTAALVAFAFTPVVPSVFAADTPSVNVAVRAEGEALAKGFEEAFNAMPSTPIYITYSREDKGFVTVAGIRSVRASGAVLIVTTDRGPMLALAAASIVVITNERPPIP